jgi:hypothetical protein
VQWRYYLLDRWSEALGFDYMVPLVLVGGHLLIVRIFSPGDLVSWPDLPQRLSVYSTGATVVSIIGGLSAIAISLYLVAAGDRAHAVRRHYQESLRRNWRSLLVAMGVAAALCLIAQTIDRPRTPDPAWFVFEVGMGIAAIRFIRLVWLFNAIMRIIDRDLTDFPRAPAPELDKSWNTKAAG